MGDDTVWYAVLRLIPWSAVHLFGEPLRNPKPEPGEPERMIPVFSTMEAATAWGEDGDLIMSFLAGKKVAPHG